MSDEPIITTMRTMTNEQFLAELAKAWDEGFAAGWEESRMPGPFVNDAWDADCPNPYRDQP